MEEDVIDENSSGDATGHEPHVHARPRLMVAIVAIVVVILVGIVWIMWGDEIQDACTGSKGACTVEIPA